MRAANKGRFGGDGWCEALDAPGFFALPIEAGATVDTGRQSALMAAFPDAPQSGQGVRRVGVDPVGKLLGPMAGLISDVSKAAGAPIGAATGDAITDSQAEAVKRLVPFQSYVGDAAGARSAHG
ncbi:hypothetical protein [Novosphingobium sp. UBA1939]|uniref:hypothetical protein n=1 Tax=Novosphingobium sp. UBA1939 TaxID=1946982 RepID=UPI0025E24B4F|nr:hypothetical protein [Novosphingobium sp. UBA1939]